MNRLPVAAHLGRTVQEVIPASFPLLEPFLLRALKGEAIADVAFTRESPEPGGKDWISLLSYQPAFDEENAVIGISVVVVDVTKHQRTEEALLESQKHYWHMVELNPQIPWIMAPDGEILDVSSQWIRLTGFTKKRSMGRGWLKALHPDDLASTIANVERSLISGNAIDIEYRVVRAGVDGDGCDPAARHASDHRVKSCDGMAVWKILMNGRRWNPHCNVSRLESRSTRRCSSTRTNLRSAQRSPP